jgi:hypothetical protein
MHNKNINGIRIYRSGISSDDHLPYAVSLSLSLCLSFLSLSAAVWQVSENEWKRMKYHLERATSIITRIENEHLDYNAQMKRLEDVATRFAPLMHRLDTNLPSIQQELGLPSLSTLLPSKAEGKFQDRSQFKEPFLLENNPGETVDEKSHPRVELVEECDEKNDEVKEVFEERSEPKVSEGDDVRKKVTVSETKKKSSKVSDSQIESHVCEIS